MFNLIKFISGFNIFNGEKLAKILFYGILIIVGITIYHKTFESKNLTINKGPVTYECKDKTWVGLKLGPIKLGVGGN